MRQCDIKNKIVLLRVDFNVPIEKNKILDSYKIIATLPTIRFLLKCNCKIIIATHRAINQKSSKDKPTGRTKIPSSTAELPWRADKNSILRSRAFGFRSRSRFSEVGSAEDGQKYFNKNYSNKIIAAQLSGLLGKKVKFVNDCIGEKVKQAVDKMLGGEILMLENLRFYKEEKENSKKFAKQLAGLADVCVNDAFAVSHRKHASIHAIKNYLPVFSGLLLEKEIQNLNKILKAKKPLIIVMGGAKIETKIVFIKKFHKPLIKVLVGGALANNFLATSGLEIGKSLINKKFLKPTKHLLNFKNFIFLPIDVVVKKNGEAIVKKVSEIKKSEIISDIGPETIKLYSNLIKNAKTIIWNGPMGIFENPQFKHGTMSIARIIANHSTGRAFGVVGGGETVQALKESRMMDYVDWVSTGGGAMLNYLSSKHINI